MGKIRMVITALALVVALGTAANGGTFASFTAQTTNAGNTFKAGTVSMSNVAGTIRGGADCGETNGAGATGNCATLFTDSALRPGASDSTNTATITYLGTLTTSDFRLFASSYSSKTASSSALCTAANPGAGLNLQVKVGSTVIYPTSGTGYGTLDGFATLYTSSANGLQLKGGTNGAGTAGVWATNDSGVYTVSYNLPSAADNSYQGCQSAVTLNFFAAQ